MTDASIAPIQLPRPVSLRAGDTLARKLMFSLLGRLQGGSLLVWEGEKSHRFGECNEAASPIEVVVHDAGVYRAILTGGSIAAGETYFRGLWSASDLPAVTRLFSANMAVLQDFNRRQSALTTLALNIAHYFRRNSKSGSKDNISAHYDLSNDFFSLFLDDSMMYSAALFADKSTTLETASIAKIDELCRQLELKQTDHLLEIGTGWGGLAIHAARHYGCRVTTTTISREQYRFACERVEAEGLADRITVLCEDYRALQGSYDKLVSVEMIEAVGHQYYSEYFRTCSELLKQDGKMVIQAITMPDQRYDQARQQVDYIKRYIFPGGCLPSMSVIAKHVATDTDMQIVHVRDITEDYAITLSHWRQRFLKELDRVRHLGFDETFIRMWDYYLCYCEGGFRERIIGTVQLAFAKPGYRLPQADVSEAA
ncbi:MAG: cyclopropane-fatty-acyl-phospholipid synthase family protein [Pseudomonadota bacterium]